MIKKLFITTLLCLSVAVLVNTCSCQIQSAAEKSNNERLEGTLNLHVISSEAKGENEATNVTVKKYAKAENGNFRFYYDIITPRVDDYLFVLALDSSGSFAYNAGEKPARQAWAVIGAVPDFLNDTLSTYKNKNFKLSIVSWDNDIDFAYTKGNFNNNDTSKVQLVSLDDVIHDVKALSPFVGPDIEGIPYRCKEEDHTNLSKPIEASLEILNAKANQPSDSHRVRKFVILVTGEGEISSRCDPRLIKAAKDSGIPIYVVGIEFKESSELQRHLEFDIGGNNNNFIAATPQSEDLSSSLLRALKAALGKALSDPVASNVRLVEPIDSCFIPGEDGTIVLKNHPNEETHVVGILNQTSIEFQFPDGLYPENVTELSFDSNFALDFPVSAIDAFQPSSLKYTWFNKKEFNISIPKNEIRIESRTPTKGQTSGSSSQATSQTENGDTRKPTEQTAEGFGILEFLLSIAFCTTYLKILRR